MIRIARLVAAPLFAPGPIQPKIGIVFFLPDDGMAVTKQQLKTGIAEFVVTTDIQQRRRFGLWRCQTLRAVIEDLGPQRHLLAQIPLHQPAGERKVAIAGRLDHRNPAPSVGGPWAEALLRPERQLVPGPPHSQTSRGAA